jgi:hypothetical protein
MTNFERWRHYMEWCNSPDNFIDFGFYYMVTAALQRRVFCGPAHRPLFPNIYGILTAEPGVGKGDVIKQVAIYLKHHVMTDPRQKPVVEKPPANSEDAVAQVAAEIIAKGEYDRHAAQEEKLNEGKDVKLLEKPLAIPVASDAVTYEALITAMARSLRKIDYVKLDETTGKKKVEFVTHSSLCFCLEEISSLFRKKTDDVVHFLLQAYDCGDYNYETIRRGKDRIRNCCLNFFGGTTPGFMQTVFNDQLLTEGFASRTFFIFASQNRKSSLYVPELSASQQVAKQSLLDHLGKLIKLYGHVQFSPESWEFLENWWQKAQQERPNTNIKLNPYYARKNMHVQKIAMAMHFGESTDMMIELPVFERALKFLADEERKMHYCLGLDSANPLAKLKEKIQSFIKRGGEHTYKALLAEFWTACPRKPDEDIKEVLEHLLITGKISQKQGENPHTGETTMLYYGVKESSL